MSLRVFRFQTAFVQQCSIPSLREFFIWWNDSGRCLEWDHFPSLWQSPNKVECFLAKMFQGLTCISEFVGNRYVGREPENQRTNKTSLRAWEGTRHLENIMYTHSLSHAHVLCIFHCVTYRHEHAWLKVFAVCMPYLSISLSPLSCFIFRLRCSRTVTSTPRSGLHRLRRAWPDPKARVKRTSARAPGRLANWPIPRA